MSEPANEPSCKPICKPTKRLEQDELLPGNLSSKGVKFSDQGQDNEIQRDNTDSSNTQPFIWQGPKQRILIISAHVPFVSILRVLDWQIDGFILIQDLSQLLQQRKFYAAPLHCWHMNLSLL